MLRDTIWLDIPSDSSVHRVAKLSFGQILNIHDQILSVVPETEMLATGVDQLTQRLEESQAAEEQIAMELARSVKKWEDQAMISKKLWAAQIYLQTPGVEHTANVWKKSPDRSDMEQISNRVYKMYCICSPRQSWSKAAQAYRTSYYASWRVSINSPQHGWDRIIAQLSDKRFDTEEAAVKYLEGRKRAYSHLFQEISPPVPQEYANCFTLYGRLLPGYRIEGLEEQPIQEPAKFTDAQQEQILKGIQSGLSQEQLNLFAKPEMPSDEMLQVRKGLEHGLTVKQVQIYARPEYDCTQMEQLRIGLECGLTAEDLSQYTDPKLDYEQMQKIRTGLEAQKEPQQSYSINLNGQAVTVQAGSEQEAALKAVEQLESQAQAAPQSQKQEPTQAPTGPKLTM